MSNLTQNHLNKLCKFCKILLMMGTKIFKIDASRAENFDENAIGPNGPNCISNASNAF